MVDIEYVYREMCNSTSDINEHLPTLYRYAKECETILETGVRGCVSSWALANGLKNNGRPTESCRELLLNDINECDVNFLLKLAEQENIKIERKWINNLDLTLEKNYDMVFIDTWHVYGQMKRELAKFSPKTNKYIILHDTTVDEIYGESIRMGWNTSSQSLETGIPEEELRCGIWKAVIEFLCENKNKWILRERFTNNNGLVVLERICQ